MNQDDKSTDDGARKRIAFLILIASLLGLLLIQSILGYFEELKSLADHDPELAFIRLKRFSSILLIVNAMATSVFAFYFMSMGWRTWKSARFPPPGTRTIRTTRTQTAARSKLIALICLFLALLILSTNAFMWYFYRKLERAANLAGLSAEEVFTSPKEENLTRQLGIDGAFYLARSAVRPQETGSIF